MEAIEEHSERNSNMQEGLERDFAGYDKFVRILDQSAVLLAAGDPDRAALLLDGLAQRIAMEWFAHREGRVPDLVYLLAHLDEQMSPIAWWLRLALRAPNAGARWVNCRRLVDEIAGLSLAVSAVAGPERKVAEYVG